MKRTLVYNNVEYNDYIIDEYGEVENIRINKKFHPSPNPDGYYMIKIGKKMMSIHRAVACTFIPNPNNYPVVNHIDSNRQNNFYKNLEWCSQRYNVHHSMSKGNFYRTLDSNQIKYIIDNYKVKDKEFGIKGLSKIFNVKQSTIKHVLQRYGDYGVLV